MNSQRKNLYQTWICKSGAIRKNYQGSTFEGNQCRKLLNAWHLIDESKHLMFKCLISSLHDVMKHLMGINFNINDTFISNAEKIIYKFKWCWKNMGLSETVKFHLLTVHVLPWTIKHKCTIGVFAEHEIESAHRLFGKRLECYPNLPRRYALEIQNALNMSPAPTRSQRQLLDSLPASTVNLEATLDETLDDIDLNDDEYEEEEKACPVTEIPEGDDGEPGNDEEEAFLDNYSCTEAS